MSGAGSLPALAVVPPHPDRYIFQMFEALKREMDSLLPEGRARGEPDAKLDDERFWRLCDTIFGTPAHTNAGLAVKARAAYTSLLALALNAGIEMGEHWPPVAILMSVINDAERLAKA